MMRRIAFAALLGSLALAPLACNNRSGMGAVEAKGDSVPRIEIGAPLYAPLKAPPEQPAALKGPAVEPIVFSGHLRMIYKVDIPSQRDGKILFIGTEIKEGEPLSDPSKVFTHPYKRDPKTGAQTMKRYRELKPGNHVEADQLVMVLDDREAMAEYDIHAAAVPSAKEEVLSAEITLTALNKILNKYKAPGSSVSEVEILKVEVDAARALSDLASKKSNLTKAEEELKKAEVLLDMHYLRTQISGTIQPFNRTPGEGVRANDTIFQVYNSSSLRAEGMVPAGFQRRLKIGMEAKIEPSYEVVEDNKLWGHNLPVTGIAFSNRADELLIVTSSEDKTVRVWTRSGELKRFKHDVGVRCVACTPVGAKQNLCLSGADDGHGRLWDLNSPNTEPRVLKDPDPTRPAHKGVIHSVAFSPDGRFCATADSNDICLWDVDSATFKYRFQTAHHHGDIESLQFTPQTKLISAARDNTIAIWSLGEKNASLDSVLDGRSGDVAHPAVSSDGRRLLFDIAQSLRVISLPSQRTEAVMQNVTDTYKFSSFAYFTPDDRFILTGTNVESRLSVWRAPSAQARAAELRQLVPKSRQVTFTCASVSPFVQQPFAAAGSKDGTVYIWPMPTEEETREPLRGQIDFVDNTTEAGSRQIRVYAKFDNSKVNLLPGGTVTVVVENPATGR